LIKSPNYKHLNTIANNCPSAVNKWCYNNNLQLNLSKSKYIVFNITNNLNFINTDFSLCVHSYNCKYLNNHRKCLPLDRVYCIKYLGISFDHRLKFNEYMYYVNNLLRKLLYKFRFLKNMLDIKTLRIIYLALVQSVFSYGISIWGCTYTTHINVIYSTVNLLIKIILRKPKLYSTSLIYYELKVRTIIQVYERVILLYMYKVNISQFQPLHCYNTRLKK